MKQVSANGSIVQAVQWFERLTMSGFVMCSRWIFKPLLRKRMGRGAFCPDRLRALLGKAVSKSESAPADFCRSMNNG